MATVAATLPRASAVRGIEPVHRTALSFPEFYFVKHIDNSRLKREVDPEKRRECFSLLGLSARGFLFIMLFAWQHFQCVQLRLPDRAAEAAAGGDGGVEPPLSLERASLADPATD